MGVECTPADKDETAPPSQAGHRVNTRRSKPSVQTTDAPAKGRLGGPRRGQGSGPGAVSRFSGRVGLVDQRAREDQRERTQALLDFAWINRWDARSVPSNAPIASMTIMATEVCRAWKRNFPAAKTSTSAVASRVTKAGRKVGLRANTMRKPIGNE